MHDFGLREWGGGVRLQDFRARSAEGAVLENSSDLSEDLFLENEKRAKNLIYWVECFFAESVPNSDFLDKLFLKTPIKNRDI